MSFLKAAFAVAAVAGVAYAGYKAAKKYPKAARAVGTVLAATANASAARASRTIHVRETETVISADKENMGGVMGMAAQAKAAGTKVHIDNRGGRTSVVVETAVLETLETIDYADAKKHFGGL